MTGRAAKYGSEPVLPITGRPAMSTTGSRPSLPPALQLVGRLAVEHAAHLKWLQRRIAGGQAAVLEDALQTAYAEALRQLRDPGRRQPEFDSWVDRLCEGGPGLAKCAACENRRADAASSSRADTAA